MSNGVGPIRLGIVGCGHATRGLHLPAIRPHTDIEVVALADTDAKRLEQVAAEFSIPGRYTDPEQLIADPNVDAVAVCVPPEHHVALAMAALDADKHLFVEKPLTLDLDAAQRLIARADRTDRTVLVGHNLRHHHHAVEARTRIRRGDLGSVEFVHAVWSSRYRIDRGFPDWRRRRATGGSALFELAVHYLDLWRYLIGNEIEEIFALSRSGEADDLTATVIARMADGVLASSAFSQYAAIGHDIEVFGHDGRLRLSLCRFDGLEFAPSAQFPGSPGDRLQSVMHTIKELPRGVASATRGGGFAESYRDQWRHFADCVRREEQVVCTLEDGMRAVQAALACIASAQSGRLVRVANAPSSPAVI
jgi:myo-inositol 2-dehydrogenase/D-chiro-inositol 1-dehydrogenase